MKIFVSAAEISSDIHAEKILKSIQKLVSENGDSVQWMGIGGPRVCALPGFRSIESSENLRTMGFVEVINKISFFKKLIKRTAVEIRNFNPDLIITFDYPDFHLRLIDIVVKEGIAPKSLRICGIPPKVWVWRSGRVEKIRKLYHGVWVVFPFEKRFYESLGIPVIYKGNPLLETLTELNSEILSNKKPLETITVMPGSRDAELKYHLPIIPKTLELFSNRIGKKVTAQVPIPSGVSGEKIKNTLISSTMVEYVFYPNSSSQSLAETQIGLIKSGTSTLEATVLKCIPVIFYKMNWLSEQIFRWLIQGIGGYVGAVGLPNILLGNKNRKDALFKELLGPEATAENLSDALFQNYSNLSNRAQLLDKCNEVRELFYLQNKNSNSAEESAKEILQWQINHPQSSKRIKKQSKAFISIVSFVWSSINWLRRRLVVIGVLPVFKVKTPSILVGNLQAGGAGKTPIVIALAKEAVSRGKKVAVVSRGYGSSKENPLGDEPQEILAAVPEVILSVGADRVLAIKKAELQKPDLIIFDDGFQNLSFKCALNLIAVTDRKRNEVPYRDFDSEVTFADVVIGTKGSKFRKVFTEEKENFFKIDWNWNNPTQKSVWLLCAIADPQELINFYQERGLKIERAIIKQDHSEYKSDEVKKLMIEAKENGCILAITEKDRVKIPSHLSDIYVLSRSIRNRDWIDYIFKFKLIKDESC